MTRSLSTEEFSQAVLRDGVEPVPPTPVRVCEVLVDVVVTVLVTRILLTAIGLLAIKHYTPVWSLSAHPVLDIWTRFDATWYVSIARDGYSYTPGHKSNAAFGPLYPILIWLGGLVFGRSTASLMLSGVVVANLATLAAAIFFYLLVRLDYERGVAERSVLYLLIFPSTLFLSAAYNLSLFLALALAAFYCARRGRWAVAGVLGGMVALTRPDGCLVAIPLAYEYLAGREFKLRELSRDVLWLGVIPLATAGWLVFQQIKFGDPLTFVAAQKEWGPVGLSTIPGMLHKPFAIGFIAPVVIALSISALFVRPTYVIYGFVTFLPMVWANRDTALRRYALLLIPIFILLALLGTKKAVDRIIVVVSAALAAVFMTRFALGYFIA